MSRQHSPFIVDETMLSHIQCYSLSEASGEIKENGKKIRVLVQKYPAVDPAPQNASQSHIHGRQLRVLLRLPGTIKTQQTFHFDTV